ncbi:MAG: aminotransferase class I/II-fold pyridoxal phosphate-dependent enzyme [Clostridiales bacterium]|nr:aminotransferase class I/II-fold pyridoxal phosphate-dependent enzyme [Clostridiales bacterium]MDY4061269.1 aminotransferase class I/II-fold pyridoxal phosphate-dependent enzyme [Anaerovoracaceae bacterium]
MREYILVQGNGRNIPKEDAIFGISMRAKKMAQEKGYRAVINGTIGALLDDDGNLLVLDSVAKVYGNMKPEEYAAYAPIGGIPQFKMALKQAAFGSFHPEEYGLFSEAVATPGGTGAIRNTIANYSVPGDYVLTTDWHWSPYGTIAGEIGRKIKTFETFSTGAHGEFEFSVTNLMDSAKGLLSTQDTLVVVLNTPAHNPTGYSISEDTWVEIIGAFSQILSSEGYEDKAIILFIDVAYIDFAGDEGKYRDFLKVLGKGSERLLPIVGYSFSKTLTMYGMRCGGSICLAKSEEIAEEFRQAMEFSSRGSWSNSPRLPQEIVAKIYGNEELLDKVVSERKEIRDMLLERGKAFEERAMDIGLPMVPYDGGFFVSIPHENPKEVCRLLEEEGIFLVPLAKGIRVSVASVSQEQCRLIPDTILEKIKDIV